MPPVEDTSSALLKLKLSREQNKRESQNENECYRAVRQKFAQLSALGERQYLILRQKSLPVLTSYKPPRLVIRGNEAVIQISQPNDPTAFSSADGFVSVVARGWGAEKGVRVQSYLLMGKNSFWKVDALHSSREMRLLQDFGHVRVSFQFVSLLTPRGQVRAHEAEAGLVQRHTDRHRTLQAHSRGVHRH